LFAFFGSILYFSFENFFFLQYLIALQLYVARIWLNDI